MGEKGNETNPLRARNRRRPRIESLNLSRSRCEDTKERNTDQMQRETKSEKRVALVSKPENKGGKGGETKTSPLSACLAALHVYGSLCRSPASLCIQREELRGEETSTSPFQRLFSDTLVSRLLTGLPRLPWW